MKKLSLSIIMLVLLSITSFAREKDKNAKLLTDLSTAAKAANQATTKEGSQFKTTSFAFNGKAVKAFYNAETDDLIGFAIPASLNEMPIGTEANLANKYPGFILQESLIFMDIYGNLDYYVSVSKPKGNKLALKISDKGKASIYARMF